LQRRQTLQLHGPSPPPASLPFAILSLVNAPYKRGFYCGDDSIRYRYRPDTITHELMAGVTNTATVILVRQEGFRGTGRGAGLAYLVHTDRLYSCYHFNNYVAAVYKVLGTFLFRAAVIQSLTDLAKYMIGRLHPNFLAVCDPKWSRVNYSVYMQLERVCRGNAADVTEARWFFVASYFLCFIHARLCWKRARLLRPMVQFFLVAFALYVGYTRVSDQKHHWSDILAGLLQGALVDGLTVRYLSDFFKAQPPQHCPKEEELERKPSLSLTVTLGEADHSHYGYPHSSS
uniref:Phosphatidic acid phosphatase type 2/haloperoxidase domain-containing protein n=1 Tax=Cebus imitator TaxID=2715852 RepID=A0A2K5QUX1_CEBIM